MSDIRCPDCDGVGKTGPVHINRGDQPHEWRESMPCWRCAGSGRVVIEMRHWMERGEVLRKARIAREESMLELARRLGMRPSEVSDMEHGRRDPSPLEASG